MPKTQKADNPGTRSSLLRLLAKPEARLVRLSGQLQADLGASTSDSLKADIDQLAAACTVFSESLGNWFSGVESNTEPEEFKNERHDAKNQLNKVLLPIQFIGMDPASEPHADLIGDIAETAEICLRTISDFGTPGWDDSTIAPKYVTTAADFVKSDQAPDLEEHPPGRLLIADDDPENRELLARLLEPHGHDMVFAENGRQAVDKIQSDDFDAVLLDIQMPEMDGFEVLDALHDSGHLRQTPVIVVTGLQDERDAVRCIEIGAEDFLSRPIRPALLMARLNASLEKKRLREQLLEQTFPKELARELARNPDPTKLEGRNADVTVLFCDIRSFSTISERLGPTQTIGWLGGVMGIFSDCIMDNGGVLVDYAGDEVVALWGAPKEQPDHAEMACNAALEIQACLPELNKKWEPIVNAKTRVGIGINTGEALVGNIGTHRKFKYGPLGTTVNLASRVQGATKYLRTPLLITGETQKQLSWGFNTRRLCRVRVNNINEPVELYEIAPPGENGWRQFRDDYETALDHFNEHRFSQASAILGDLLVANPEDGPSLQLMSRVVDAMLKNGSAEGNFDPIWELPGK
ncbi:MAG: response regulator [Verrucomicrobiales bacterium]|nr:response regulator [Verrucomicrobiales bacterium]